MDYQYKNDFLDFTGDSETYEKYKAMSDEIINVYAKAHTLDKIINIDDLYFDNYGHYPSVEEYSEEVENILNNMEDK